MSIQTANEVARKITALALELPAAVHEDIRNISTDYAKLEQLLAAYRLIRYSRGEHEIAEAYIVLGKLEPFDNKFDRAASLAKAIGADA